MSRDEALRLRDCLRAAGYTAGVLSENDSGLRIHNDWGVYVSVCGMVYVVGWDEVCPWAEFPYQGIFETTL